MELETLQKNMVIRRLAMPLRTAKEAGVKTLIANHISARFMASDVAQLLKQGRQYSQTYISLRTFLGSSGEMGKFLGSEIES